MRCNQQHIIHVAFLSSRFTTQFLHWCLGSQSGSGDKFAAGNALIPVITFKKAIFPGDNPAEDSQGHMVGTVLCHQLLLASLEKCRGWVETSWRSPHFPAHLTKPWAGCSTDHACWGAAIPRCVLVQLMGICSIPRVPALSTWPQRISCD